MTAEDFQLKLNALVQDLSTTGKGQRVTVTLRDIHNAPTSYSLSSTPDGTVNPAELKILQDAINDLAGIAGAYAALLEPVKIASERLRNAAMQYADEQLAISGAREALANAQMADPVYSEAKASLEAARNNPQYQTARNDYNDNNVSENYGELISSRGKYISAEVAAPESDKVPAAPGNVPVPIT